MALYCSGEIFEALDGLRFPTTKAEIIDFAETKDAREAVIVVLNQLKNDAVYRDVSSVCENARIVCNYEIVRVLERAPFPATREDLMEFADRIGAPPLVKDALLALPFGYTFRDLSETCEFIL